MGCGILFPRDYHREWDESDEPPASNGSDVGIGGNEVDDTERDNRVGLFDSSESEDEEWWGRPNAETGTKVQVS